MNIQLSFTITLYLKITNCRIVELSTNHWQFVNDTLFHMFHKHCKFFKPMP